MSNYPHVPQQIFDPISENLAKLSELFPAAVKDGALDMEALRAELGEFEEIKPGDETFELNWVGKQAAKKEAFKPLLGKTLALKDDGKNSDTTQNLYIEGDNLEALKLLRQNYYGEIEMIYIDPPYNTGNDFIYTDNFKTSIDESDLEEGNKSDEGKRHIKNERSSNRFHARWLNIMYPLLRLSKDILADGGLIAVTINEVELSQLEKLLQEVFGESNRVAIAPWKSEASGGKEKSGLRTGHEYVLVYCKTDVSKMSYEMRETGKMKFSDSLGPYAKGRELMKWGGNSSRSDRPGQWYGLKQPDGNLAYPYKNNGEEGHWRWGKTNPDIIHAQENPDYFHWELTQFDKGVVIEGRTKRWVPYEKIRTQEKPVCWGSWLDSHGRNADATEELKLLFEGSKPFDTPKPTKLIKWLINLHANDDITVLDFFSGSATTAHAVAQLNAEDGGKRKSIMVQLPEVCPEDSEALKMGYKTIPEIGKERIRRAGEKIKEELETKHDEWKKQQELNAKKGEKLEIKDDEESEKAPNPYVLDPDLLDIGFKSFRIEDTKINWLRKDLRGEQLEFDDTTTQDALDFVPGYTDTDVIYELILRQSNISLTGSITKPITEAKRTYLYADAYLVCLEETITQKLVESLASIEPTPNKYFFRDSAFGTDIALKDETFRRLKAEIHKNHGDLGAAYTVEFI